MLYRDLVTNKYGTILLRSWNTLLQKLSANKFSVLVIRVDLVVWMEILTMSLFMMHGLEKVKYSVHDNRMQYDFVHISPPYPKGKRLKLMREVLVTLCKSY